ncbi:MAG: OmpH family outer membrane protein [Pyrinomonadaceae bacterium]
MKRIRLIAAALMLAALLVVSAAAQTRPGAASTRPAAPQVPAASNAPVPDTKMAFIDTGAFGDEKGGITRYVNAVKKVEREFQPRQTELVTLQNRIKALADEISKLSGNSVVDPKTIQAKQDEGERLQRDLKYKKEQADADFTKRYQEEVSPISTDIGKALDQFATQRGITMILDISKLAPAILTVNPAMDVTAAFIAEFNTKNPATASAATGRP